MTVQMKRGFTVFSGIAVGAIALLATAHVSANPIVNFSVDVAGGTPFAGADWSQTGVPQATPGLFSVTNTQGDSPYPFGLQGPNGEWDILWNLTADDDIGGLGGAAGAQLTSGFTVTNNLPEIPGDGPASGQPGFNHLQFSIFIEMQVDPVLATAFFGGGNFTLLAPGGSGNFNEIYAHDGAIYTFLINGNESMFLYPEGYSLGLSGPGTTTHVGPGSSLSSQTGAFANTVVSSIGIHLVFDLTPGETLTFNGVLAFVPAPGCLALLGLAGLAGRARRRDE